ncbi:MAG: DNA mismatch repair endonuclease MutL [Mixta calida]|uniref:DNA mismatch repair endonuclease MutL n=1 Tax=Mixta TaxID=2100764 RepID=UPI000CDDFDF5|nr:MULTISPECIES: DNA mismatch repair endonuclease MutL [Mixta]MDU3817471.1 DNA mismatch repair endonuclease MutL [Pantoea sp.]POU47481.1 DNA mismatch repair endonuclease MutL [Pantoea sp. PSNIH5]POU66095.1 DNA mismatch repair endonuclease MutL [Pantoea sp. PSNIH4]POY68045.1 DNA mismatch repair endonuclease MutL [Pantoea sp. PSNIH3]HCW46768.1 DNA mismatch repair endonuclease MutL [Erwiniaceae bacterium]
MPIQILPPQLANQIAAGEVVERPASVVKELVENSLDAGATRIDIDIEKGGAKLIRIRDNGCGISKAELAMALARHATSKITSLDDLEAIVSLGFRGEALASISSVSRLTLTSRTAEQQEAWQAYAEGRDMTVTVKPAAHPPGTTLEVLDLFYNTPARRKFMRTEKTEFAHIDEVVRRIALARFDIAISLTHNGKLVRQYRAAAQESQQLRRLGAICGATFMDHALKIEWQHGDLALRGWVADPAGARQVSELQYCYVNGRMMRDKLINHAIRQAYQEKLGGDHQPAYVLYLHIDPHQVDVNVHPAKHEVRFHQSRLVHDFIYQGVISVLQESGAESLPLTTEAAPRWQPENRQAAGGNHFSSPPPTPVEPSAPAETSPPRQPSVSAAAPRAGNGGGAGGHAAASLTGWPQQQPGYQKREGALYQQLLQTPTPAEKTPSRAQEPVAAPLRAHSQSLGRVLTVLHDSYAVVERDGQLALIALTVASRWLRQAQLEPGAEGLKPQPLLIPVRLKLAQAERQAMQRHDELLRLLGIDLQSDGQHVTLRAVPLPLRQQNLQNLIPELLGYLARQQDISSTLLAQWLARQAEVEHTHWNHSQAIALLADVERLCPALLKSPPPGLLQPIDTEKALNALKHE